MNISATYRLIASVLSLSILIGVSIPSGLHAMSGDVCDEMEEMHDAHSSSHEMPVHAEDCPMDEQPHHQNHPEQKADKAHHKAHDLGFACACSIEEAPVKTEVPVYQKVKIQVIEVVQIRAKIYTTHIESDNHSFLTSDAYSPPPIYLLNESFLK